MHSPVRNLVLWCAIGTGLVAGVLFFVLQFGALEFIISTPERELTRTPIGRVHAGIRFEQIIEIPNHDPTMPAGLSLCLATYKEKNSGQLLITISQQNVHANFTIDAAKIVDNDWVFLLFPETMQPGEAVIKISGANNTADSAPTVWANEPGGKHPLIENGTSSNKKLEVRFYVIKSPWSLLVEHTGSELVSSLLAALFSVTTGCTLGALIVVLMARPMTLQVR